MNYGDTTQIIQIKKDIIKEYNILKQIHGDIEQELDDLDKVIK